MKGRVKKILVALFIIFLIIQLYQPARNKNEVISSAHITQLFEIPDTVNSILATSCYDCHSNNTRYPWYSFIQPGRFIMERHIRKGKSELNFSEFGSYTTRQQESKFKSISKQVKNGDMPLRSYTFLHKNAKLDPNQRQAIVSWVDTILKKYEELNQYFFDPSFHL